MQIVIADLYQRLARAYGPQGWWPADDAFEMMIGAILIQHTAWPNAAKAIGNLRAAGLLAPEPIANTSSEQLARLIQPAGVYNVKAKRIESFVRWYLANGGFDALSELNTPVLREALLCVHGVGPETADAILVYAFDRPVFVVDAYTRRLLRRYGPLTGREPYAEIRALVEDAMPADPDVLGEFHALVVEHAKAVCRSRPVCEDCCLKRDCARVADVLQ